MTRSSYPRHATPAASEPRHRICEIRSGSVRFGHRLVLDDVDLTVGPSDRIALIGDNGAGKSTLLHALAGTTPVTTGERLVDLPRGLSMAEQNPEFDDGATVAGALDQLLAEVHDIETEIRVTAGLLERAESDAQAALLEQLGAAMDRFEARDGYRLDQRVDAALDQLSLGSLDRDRLVGSLSGGERTRLALAAALSSEAELLLLDEPTNNLDGSGIAWLEDRIARHRGALVVVTHDRAFLDSFATDIVCVEGGRLKRYGDGYVGYLAARASERRRLLDEYEAWRNDVARSEALVAANAFRLDAIPRKQAMAGFGHGAFRARSRDHGASGRIRQSKERLARLHDDPAPRPADPLTFAPRFDDAHTAGQGDSATADAVVIAAEAVRLGGQGPGLALSALQVRAGDRWLVSGPNGAGKTTLLRVLAGELAPHHGEVRHRADLRVAWLRQDLSGASGKTMVEEFAAQTGRYAEDAVESLLALGLFLPNDLERTLAAASIGQRRRLELALAVAVPSDVLLLDEPTNHLAPELVEQLEDALRGYPGAVVTVTHDRRWRERAEAAGSVRQIVVNPGGRVQTGGFPSNVATGQPPVARHDAAQAQHGERASREVRRPSGTSSPGFPFRPMRAL